MLPENASKSNAEINLAKYLLPASFYVPSTEVTSSWIEHTPFAMWIMEAIRPRTFVELGSLHGVSYFTFCESALRLGSRTRCFAIDTWKGDEHTGFYDDTVLAGVRAINDAHYSSFSTLLQRTFDEALVNFSDNSIDLLHIDGRHRYEDVRRDFESWLPKLSNWGVVLLHDTNEFKEDFGVAKFWKEIQHKFPSFEFLHGHGLGVVAVGSEIPPRLSDLFKSSQDSRLEGAVRAAYARLGGGIRDRLSLKNEQIDVANLRLSVQILERTAKEAAAQIEELQSAKGKLELGAANGAAQIQRLEKEKGELQLEAQHFLKEKGELQLEAQHFLQDRQMLQTRLEQIKSQHDELLSSTSWRVTAPLRSMRGSVGRTGIVRRLVSLPRRVLRERRTMLSISQTGLFDSEWYIATYPDVVQTPKAALRHFVRHGAKEGRRPNPLFDTSWYLCRNPDIATAGVNPLLHYARNGASEGRFPNAHFDGKWYLEKYPDVATANENPLAHYLRSGAAEGRKPARDFAPEEYRRSHPEIPVERAFEHFIFQHPAGVPVHQHIPASIPGSATHFAYQPLVSIIMPVFNIEAEWLRKAVRSVQAQTYPNWELCICDDGSTAADTIRALADLESEETLLRVKRLQENGGISKASNEALAFATGDFVAFLDNDDELEPTALESYVAAINHNASIDVIYSDEDKLSVRGIREESFLKPDWSPSMFREVMYVGHFLLVRRNLIEQIGGFDSTYDGVQDYELMLRLSEHTSAIHHVHKVLYHWRRIPGSIADRSDAKPNIGLKQVAAVNAHLARMDINATAQIHPSLTHRAILVPKARDTSPRVSIIISTKDAPEFISRCLASIFEKSTYPDFEVVVVDNGTTDEVALSVLDQYPVIRVPYSEPFNFSRANNVGVAASTGDVLVLLNNDTEVLEGDWLEQMLFFLDDPNVGAVGPLLLYPDRSVQHAGVALGIRGTADHVLRGLPEDSDGYFGSLSCTREVSAVTFACVMVRKEDFYAVGGLSEFYRSHYQDVDFCMRLRAIDRRIVYTPRTRLIHFESATRGSAYDNFDRALLLDCWGVEIGAGDPYSRWESELSGVPCI